MRYFVTGFGGFVGKNLVEELKEEGNVYCFSRNDSLNTIRTFKPDVIYHLAAEIYDAEKMMDSNILLTYRLLEEARNLPDLKAFIAVGSSSEYGYKDHPMSEKDYLDPRTMYEATKGSATLLCQAYARMYKMRVMIARPFSLYGRHEPEHRFIPTIINAIKNDKNLIVAPGVHDFIHVSDFISGLRFLENSDEPGEIFNFGSGRQTSNDELVAIIEEIMHKKADKTKVPPLHEYDSLHWVADISKAIFLGWEPQYYLEEGLQETIEEILQ